jgi:hypothetical protein
MAGSHIAKGRQRSSLDRARLSRAGWKARPRALERRYGGVLAETIFPLTAVPLEKILAGEDAIV